MKITSCNEPYMRIIGITKKYANNIVLNNIDLDICLGEVVGIVGENGAGKSTLIKILAGAIMPSSGMLEVDGKMFTSLSPDTAAMLGIHAIYQESILVPSMNVIENIFVGHEITNIAGVINKRKQLKRTMELIDMLKISLDPTRLIKDLDVADQQYVKIMKALERNSRVLIMDEPTTMFNNYDVQIVLQTVNKLKEHGISVIFISHHLDEVIQVSDRIVVIRDGNLINIYNNVERHIKISTLTMDMVGRTVDKFYKRVEHMIGDTILEISDIIVKPGCAPVSFSIKKGEIVGISGIVGAGRTELARKIFGADKHRGTIKIRGEKVRIDSPRHAISNGVAFITEDRQRTGLNLRMNIIDNMVLVDMGASNIKWFSKKKSWHKIKKIYEKMRIKANSPTTEVRFLSGGNQQKVVLGKWMLIKNDIIIFDEPTRGIDVNAKSDIYDIITSLASEGNAIILISSDMPELISLSDRVLVMRNSVIVKEFEKEEISEHSILSEAIGV